MDSFVKTSSLHLFHDFESEHDRYERLRQCADFCS